MAVTSDDLRLLAELTRETRDDVKTLIGSAAACALRLDGIERRLDAHEKAALELAKAPPAPPASQTKRDAIVTVSGSALAVAIVSALQALGIGK
jgi:hypothetical protein